MRKYLVALVVIIGLAAPFAAHADTYTYNLDLVNFSGITAGTGSFTITSLPTGILSTYSTDFSTLTAMSFSIGGDNFNITHALNHYGAVGFTGTQLLGIAIADGNLVPLDSFISGSNVYFYGDLTKLEASSGNYRVVSVVDNPSASAVTPEPSALVLFGTGALGLAALVSRRRIA